MVESPELNRAAVLEQFAIQAELQLEASHTIAASLAAAQEQITYLENVILRQSALQAELQQRTVHTITASLAATEAVIIDRAGGSLFMQSALIEMEREAVAFFQSGKYAQARDLFFTVATAQPENFEARFFHLYSLFLNNRMDRSNYPRIREGFLALERHGFIREEIRAVLEFIEREELGYPMAEASL